MTATGHAPSPTAPSVVAGGLATWPAALLGMVAAAVALGVSELVAGLVRPVPSLLYAIGGAVIEAGAGTPVKDLAIRLFGSNEKTALVIGTVLLSLMFGAGLGVVARRRGLRPAVIGFVLFGLLGVLATTVSPLDSTTWAVPAAGLAVVAGVWVLRVLLDIDARTQATSAGARRSQGGPVDVAKSGRGRRDLFRIAAGLAAVAGVSGGLGRALLSRSETSAARAAVVLPEADTAVSDVATGTSFSDIAGLSPLFTPNDDFYRIDTALMPPVVDVQTWRMRVHGMVANEIELDFDDLLAMEQFEADVTIACVSNEVGGDLIGNARWQGVPLSALLERAGADPAATQIVGRSVDGWTAGFPTEVALDGRDTMIAIAMNGEPLPIAHGFPARLIVPGLYGYVSATKWLQDIELTTWDAFDGYWVPRGWSKEGPIKTQSRIDVPRQGQSVTAGATVIAGVAWAQRRGVAAVEISIDEGPWEQAVLAEAISIDTWRQWRLSWDATPGEHVIRVRATDSDGTTQSEVRVPVAPNGAEGYHQRIVRVS